MSERKCLYIPVVSHDMHIRRVDKRFERLKFELSTVCNALGSESCIHISIFTNHILFARYIHNTSTAKRNY